MSFRCLTPSTHPTSAMYLVALLQDAQSHERQLRAVMPAGGSGQLTLADAADGAWTRVRDEAEALVAQAVPDTTGRETRLAAALLLAILDTAEPQQVARLQEVVRQISDADNGCATRPDPVADLLQFVARGPFVLSGADHVGVTPEEDRADEVLTI